MGEEWMGRGCHNVEGPLEDERGREEAQIELERFNTNDISRDEGQEDKGNDPESSTRKRDPVRREVNGSWVVVINQIVD